MARGTSSGNYYTVDRRYNGATALSAAAWIYYSTSGDHTIAGLWEGGTPNRLQWLISVNASNQAVIAVNDTSAGIRVVIGGTVSRNAWQHIALAYSSSGTNGVQGFLNGSSIGFTSAGTLKTETDNFGLGARQAGVQPFPGRIAEFATWTSRLTTAQVDSLAKGFAPPKVLKPDCYIPLVRDVSDLANKYAITTVGAPTVENHPRIYK